jgi:hypothetical protein
MRRAQIPAAPTHASGVAASAMSVGPGDPFTPDPGVIVFDSSDDLIV